MYAIVCLAAVATGVFAALAAAIWLALRIAQLRRRLATLPSHPTLEREWLERQALIGRDVAANLDLLTTGLKSLGASITHLALAVHALDRTRRFAAAATEDFLNRGLPWLRGLFARR